MDHQLFYCWDGYTTAGGLAGLIAGWATNISVNVNVTIFNTSSFFAGGLQLLSAMITLAGTVPTPISTRKPLAIIGYIAMIGFIIAISALVVLSFTPIFSASGPTLTHNGLLDRHFIFCYK